MYKNVLLTHDVLIAGPASCFNPHLEGLTALSTSNWKVDPTRRKKRCLTIDKTK